MATRGSQVTHPTKLRLLKTSKIAKYCVIVFIMKIIAFQAVKKARLRGLKGMRRKPQGDTYLIKY